MADVSKLSLMEGFKLDAAAARELATRLRLAVSDQEVKEALEYASSVIHGHGVETVRTADGRAWDSFWRDALIVYVNMGDPYYRTILYDVRKGRFAIGAWGDWVEIYESCGGSVAGLAALRRRGRKRRRR